MHSRPSSPYQLMRRSATVLVAASVFAAIALGFVPNPEPGSATASFAITAYAGGNRYDTAAKVAVATFPTGASTVLLATGVNFPDALAAAFLAGADKSPILLTTTHTPIPPEALTALQTLKAKNVVVLGGPLAVGDDVVSALSATTSSSSGGGNLNVTRIAGQNRFSTAAALATASGTTPGTVAGAKTAIVANGLNFPDALSAGPASYAKSLPVLLTDPNVESAETEQALQTLGITQILLMGGTAAVSDAVATQLSHGGTRTVTREAGADRTDTAGKFYEYEIANLNFVTSSVALANGGNFPDALTGSPNAGSVPTGVLLTADATNLGQYTTAEVTAHASTLSTGIVYGGPVAVSTAAKSAFSQAAGGPVIGPITLTSTTVAPGAALSGSIANPSTVSSLSATGCGLTNQAVTVSSSDGSFSVTIPSTQATGTCTLTFTITPTGGGSTTTQAFSITVSTSTTGGGGGPMFATTSGPDLTGATVDTTHNTVTFTFDKTTFDANPPANGFHVYDYQGHESTPPPGATTVSSGAVTVQFTAAQLVGATMATVSPGTVFVPGSTGHIANPIGSAGIMGTTVSFTPGATTGPNLVSVSNLKLTASPPTADFTFDVAITPLAVAGPNGFMVVFTDNSAVASAPTDQVGMSTDNKTATVKFSGLATCTTSCRTLSRGVVFANTVNTAPTAGGTASAVLQTALSGLGNSAAAAVELANSSAIALTGVNTATFTLDTGVQPLGTVAPANFNLYSTGGTVFPATAVSRSLTDTTKINATFGSNLSSISGGWIAAGSVTTVNSAAQNQPTSGVYPVPAIAAGVTNLPDLVSVGVVKSTGAVTFVFDKSLTAAGYTFNTHDFFLYDASAAGSNGTGGTISTDGKTVTFAAGGFTSTAASTAVLGAVIDSADVAGAEANPPTKNNKFPQGSRAVTTS